MNRPIVITTLVACGLAVLWQRYSLGRLERDLVDRRAELASLVGSSSALQTPTEQISDEDDKASPVAEGLLLADLLKLVPTTVEGPQDPEFARILPGLLSAVEGHSALDLIALVENRAKALDGDGRADAVAAALLILAAEQEPERVLALVEANEKNGRSQIRWSAFAALARRDPAKARYLLGRADWEDHVKHPARAAIFNVLARADFGEAVAFLREQPEGQRGWHSAGVLNELASDKNLRTQMLAAIEVERDSGVQRMLAESIARATFRESGFEGVEKLLSEVEFPNPSTRDEFVDTATGAGRGRAPAESIEWLLDQVSEKNRTKYFTRNLCSWAEEDHVAAGEYLRAQEPSLANNQVVSQFALAIFPIDPAAALEWSGDITRENTRRNTRKLILDQWRRKNPEAAAAWIEEQSGAE